MRIALLSDVTVELLAELFKPEDSVWCPPGFGAWQQVCLDLPSDLRTFDPELVVLLLHRPPTFMGSVPTVEKGSVPTAKGSVPAADKGSVPTVEGSVPTVAGSVPTAKGSVPAADKGSVPTVEDLCGRLRIALPGATVVRVDLQDLADEVGPRFFDARIQALSGCPWSLVGQRAIREEIRRLAALRTAPPKKVLAVDFDGVLWGQTLAEDGWQAVEPSVDFQRGLLALKRRGILLVGLTKNDAADLVPVWSVPRMVLKADDFAAIRANGRAKAENLVEVAQELNLGTDAFVFADDNPGECAAMASARPEVTVVPVPNPTASAIRHLTRLFFPDFGTTEADRLRAASYGDEVRRREAAKGLTLESYLASLETVVDFHPSRTEEISRLAQLSQRCNQFNVRQSRYDERDVRRILADASRCAYSVAVRDRFGDQGLVAFVVVSRDGETARLEEWVMSCRAMNRRIEDETWSRLRSELRQLGFERIQAEVRPTEKNRPIHGLFTRLVV